ncbi:hypothetical protein K3152_10605 [Qipengyuania sp. 1NDH17]|uniref:Tim44-like domain-containing protein n=1 Tax=Qipengyuania polymorpha TaxID=2867234 RepID=A0ABS7J2Y7_9SPHN|nr:hypothetical protein [Qipengyuania polymorpha]MBX7458695.1 hypothetical protein [Qipengyuania polymorpha]
MEFLDYLFPLLVVGIVGYVLYKANRNTRVNRRSKSDLANELFANTRISNTGSSGGHVETKPTARFTPAPHHFPVSSYGGSELRAPHGFDIAEPERRTIPDRFQGDWLWEGATEDAAEHRIALRAQSVTYIHALGAEPVVGAYTLTPGDPDEIAVVTQQMDNGEWAFATYLFKLLEGDTKLTNIESMDMRWDRLS